MAKRWSQQDTSYLRRYAASKTLAALAERFEVGDDVVRARLAELGLVTRDGEPAARGGASRDPEIGDYEKALQALGKGDFTAAGKLLERVVEASDRPELAARARQHLSAIARRTGGGDEADPYTRAVFDRNRGDHAAALAVVQRQKRDDDGRFALLAAALHCLEGREEEAAAALRRAVEKDPANRVRAFHDPDLALLRENEEHAHLFGLAPS